MTFHIPSLMDLRIVFDENDSEYIIFDEFSAFLESNKCGDEPAIKSGNMFSVLKGKDHRVKSVEGKPSLKLESIVQYCCHIATHMKCVDRLRRKLDFSLTVGGNTHYIYKRDIQTYS
ncbi:hypothetical protein DPMN_027133 [Dreissena polymorpha]|uniref:Uncharacterized protein n=1 Tax=Dreissena polymorpha TaxID=45954 RepID=A0A9D4RDC7_DREPO|nr:hypothetical protein DPMN_027133 [Dreissena polymorpha]